MNRNLVALTALLFLINACGQVGSKDVIKLGVVAPMTGGNAWLGIDITTAVQMVVQKINDAGGINGKKIQVIIEDADTSQKSSTATNKLIAQDGVNALYAITTPVVAAAAPIADQNKVILFGFTSVNTYAKKNQYVFIDLRNIQKECGLLSKATEQQGDANLAFLGTDTDFSDECLNVLKQNPTLHIVSNEIHLSGDPDARTVLVKIKEADPQALVLLCWTPDCNIIYKQMLELGVHYKLYLPIALPLPASKKSLEGLDKEFILKDAIGSDTALDPDNPTPELKKFMDDYKTFTNGKELVSAPDTAVAADNIYMLAEAMKQCPDLGSDCVRDQLSQADYTGYAGHVAYGGNHWASRDVRAITYKDGKWIPLE